MNIVRDTEFAGSGFGFTDEYGSEKDLTNVAARIIRAVTASKYKKAWIPLVQGQKETLTKEAVKQMHKDKAVLYLLPTTIEFDGYEPKYVYTDASFTKKIGAIDKNVVIVDLTVELTKDRLLELIEKAADATEERNVEAARREYEKKQVQKFMDGRKKARRIEIDRDCESSREELKSVSNKLIYLTRRIEELELLKIAYAENSDETAKVEAEIAELFESKQLVGVRFDEDRITFITKPLGITDRGGKFHPIGEFEVGITMSNSAVVIKNMDNKIAGGENIPHPHCGPEGIPCLGNIGSVIPGLTATYDILGLWQIVLSFLTSYNHNDSWGARLKYWPAIDRNGKPVDGSNLEAPLTGEEAPVRKQVYCDACGEDHYEDEYTMHKCPICGEWFCEENTEWHTYNGAHYCSSGCVNAKKVSEGVAV